MTYEAKYICDGCKKELLYDQISYEVEQKEYGDKDNRTYHFCTKECLLKKYKR